MDSLGAQYILDIIRKEMNIAEAYTWLRNTNRLIPNDKKLYIVAGKVSARALANVTKMELIEGVESQVNYVQMLESIQIDIASDSAEAMQRDWEVIAAMQSFYAQQMQELHNFKIFRIPQSFVDTSAAEGGSLLKRYTITISCMVWYRKTKAMLTVLGDYYDQFSTRVDDEETIGTPDPIIEFEINSGGIVP